MHEEYNDADLGAGERRGCKRKLKTQKDEAPDTNSEQDMQRKQAIKTSGKQRNYDEEI